MKLFKRLQHKKAILAVVLAASMGGVAVTTPATAGPAPIIFGSLAGLAAGTIIASAIAHPAYGPPPPPPAYYGPGPANYGPGPGCRRTWVQCRRFRGPYGGWQRRCTRQVRYVC